MITKIQYFAPLFFILCAGFRCFLETSMFGTPGLFSYYTLTHHTLWYLAAMLGSILTLHLILKTELKQLNWLFYSAGIFFIPIVYAMMTGDNLQLKYLDPEPFTILKSSLSACFLNPSNRPQFFEIAIIDAGILVIGWLASKNMKKALLTMVAVHGVLTLFGIKWFYSKPGSPGLIQIATHLSNHIWLSLVWLLLTSFFVQVILFKTSSGHTRKNMIKGTVSGLLLWTGTVVALKAFQGNITLFDASTITIPVYTAGLIATVYHQSRREKLPSHVRALLFSTLVIQLSVVLPMVLNIRQALVSAPVVVPF